MPPIKLLIATEYLNEGGVGRQIHYLVNSLDRARFEIHLAVFRRRDLFFTDLLDSGRLSTYLLDGGRGVGPRSWVELIRLCRRLRPDIVHLFGGKANHIGGLASFFCAIPAVIFSVRSATVSPVNDVVYRILKSRPNLTIVNSEGTRRQLLERSGYLSGQVVVQHNFLDTRQFRPFSEEERAAARRHFGFGGQGPYFATIGRLAPQKNQLAVVEALGELKESGELPRELVYLLVGRPYDVSYAARVERRRRERGLEGICRTIDPVEDVHRLYNALDGVLQPSTYEGLSNVVIEAQACGTPVALSRQGDNDGLVRHGETGVSFDLREASAVTGALGEMIALASDGPRRALLAGRAREEVAGRFSLDPEIARLQEVYEELLGRGG